MAQFDVYPNPSRKAVADMPFVVDIQVDLLRELPTRVLVPLARPSAMGATPHLNPQMTVEGQSLVLMTNHLVSLPVQLLGTPIASLEPRRNDIVAALDFLFTGI